jgi:hypothetical protein
VPYRGFPNDELNDILDWAKSMSWHTIMLELNLDVQDMSWDKILHYYKRSSKLVTVSRNREPRMTTSLTVTAEHNTSHLRLTAVNGHASRKRYSWFLYAFLTVFCNRYS